MVNMEESKGYNHRIELIDKGMVRVEEDSVVSSREEESGSSVDELSARLYEREEQLETLLEAVHLLARLACLPENTSSECEDKDDITVSIHREMDELNQVWKLEETALPLVASCIGKLQSRIKVVSHEAESLATENLSLRESLAEYEKVNTVLKKSLEKTLKEKVELKSALHRRNQERRVMVKTMKEYIKGAESKAMEEEVRIVELETKLHENVLMNAMKDHRSDDESTKTSVSTYSSIFDDGMATVNLYKEQRSPEITQKKIKNNTAYHLTFRGGKLGLQFLLIPTLGTEWVYMFIVCGFMGFHDELNVRPAVGARLIAIDEESVEHRRLIIEQLHKKINEKIRAGASFVMTFRNEELDKRQREALERAVKATGGAEVKSGIYKIRSDTEGGSQLVTGQDNQNPADNSTASEHDTKPNDDTQSNLSDISTTNTDNSKPNQNKTNKSTTSMRKAKVTQLLQSMEISTATQHKSKQMTDIPPPPPPTESPPNTITDTEERETNHDIRPEDSFTNPAESLHNNQEPQPQDKINHVSKEVKQEKSQVLREWKMPEAPSTTNPKTPVLREWSSTGTSPSSSNISDDNSSQRNFKQRIKKKLWVF